MMSEVGFNQHAWKVYLTNKKNPTFKAGFLE